MSDLSGIDMCYREGKEEKKKRITFVLQDCFACVIIITNMVNCQCIIHIWKDMGLMLSGSMKTANLN